MKANFHLSVLQSDRLVSCIAFHFLLLPAVFQRDFYITQVKKVLSIQYKHHAEITQDVFIYSIFFNFCQKGDSPANGEVYLNIREKKKNSCAKWNNRLLRWSGLFLYGHPFPLRALIFGETLTGQLKETYIININKYNSQTNGNVPALAAVYIALKISSVYVLAHTHIFPHSDGFLFFFMW